MDERVRTERALAVAFVLVMLPACEAMRQSGPETPDMRPAGETIEATPEAVEQAYMVLQESDRNVAREWQGRTFEEFEASVYREPETGTYIVNGDVPITDPKHLEEFFETEVQRAGPLKQELIVNQAGGVDTVWDEATKRTLTYCVSTSFGNRSAAVRDAMTEATEAWERVADVDFVHAATQDSACTATNAQVLFDVGAVSGQPYLARAFFPDDSRGNRNVLINDSAFDLDPNDNLSLAGILRHELGHTLGFRHEHTRPEAGTCFEDDNWRPLTSYDAFSVMHYPQCNGAGDWRLALTDFDESGAACLYGPAPGFTIDTDICAPAAPAPEPPACGPRTVTVSGSVGQDEEAFHGPFQVAPGTRFKAAMAGSGDPDLYVRFDQQPSEAEYDCRPYLSGAVESCDLPVGAGSSNAFLMVRGYQPGSYQITIEHAPGS